MVEPPKPAGAPRGPPLTRATVAPAIAASEGGMAGIKEYREGGRVDH